MNNKFDVREYVDRVYGEKVLEWYEEDFGLNGLDRLWQMRGMMWISVRMSMM